MPLDHSTLVTAQNLRLICLCFRPHKLHLGMSSTQEPHLLCECVAGAMLKSLKTPVRPDMASSGNKSKIRGAISGGQGGCSSSLEIGQVNEMRSDTTEDWKNGSKILLLTHFPHPFFYLR